MASGHTALIAVCVAPFIAYGRKSILSSERALLGLFPRCFFFQLAPVRMPCRPERRDDGPFRKQRSSTEAEAGAAWDGAGEHLCLMLSDAGGGSARSRLDTPTNKGLLHVHTIIGARGAKQLS